MQKLGKKNKPTRLWKESLKSDGQFTCTVPQCWNSVHYTEESRTFDYFKIFPFLEKAAIFDVRQAAKHNSKKD